LKKLTHNDPPSSKLEIVLLKETLLRKKTEVNSSPRKESLLKNQNQNIINN
jgi:hypothetical protein